MSATLLLGARWEILFFYLIFEWLSLVQFKGTFRPDWICLRVVYHWIDLERDINHLKTTFCLVVV
jgi:hypothetical protein